MTWARMTFKPAKSQSLALRKDRETDQFHFNLRDMQIPTVSEEPVKSLGKLFSDNLKVTTAGQGTKVALCWRRFWAPWKV